MSSFFQKYRTAIFIIFTIALLIILFLLINQFSPKKSPEIIDSYTDQNSTTTTSNNQATISDQNILNNLPYFVPDSFDVYATHDDNGNIIIRADLIGCTDYQTEPLEEQITEYLKSKNIQYPIQFTYCN